MERRKRDGGTDGEREASTLVLFMGAARISVRRAFNVKPVLSFTRFKGVVTARNHAARVHSVPVPFTLESVEMPTFFYSRFNSFSRRWDSRTELARSFYSAPSRTLFAGVRSIDC